MGDGMVNHASVNALKAGVWTVAELVTQDARAMIAILCQVQVHHYRLNQVRAHSLRCHQFLQYATNLEAAVSMGDGMMAFAHANVLSVGVLILMAFVMNHVPPVHHQAFH